MNKKLKQALSVLLCFCMVFGSVAVSGESIGSFLGSFVGSFLSSLSLKASAVEETTYETATDFSWSFDSTSSTLTISGNGAMPDYTSGTSTPWYVYQKNIWNIVVSEGITRIGNYAFGNIGRLTDISFPSTLKSIGSYAFYGDSDKDGEVWTLPTSLLSLEDYAFSGCVATTALTVPCTVQSLGAASLASVTSVNFIGCEDYWNTVTGYSSCGVGTKTFTDGCKIGDTAYLNFADSETAFVCGSGDIYTYEDYTQSAWYGYRSTVKSVSFAEGCPENISVNMFRGFTALSSVTFSNGVKYIGQYAFCGCSALTSVDVNGGVETVGPGAFESSGLTSVTFSDKVKTICGWAFASCKLVNVEIPDSVTEIGGAAFIRNEWTLKSIKFPKNLKTIEESTCQECYALNSITFPENLEKIENNAFLFARFNGGSLVFPETLTYIGNHAFRYAYGLTELTIPKNVTHIGYQAFRCAGDGDSVTSFSLKILSTGDLDCSYSFQDCYKLTSVTLAEGLTSIGTGLFSGCTGLTSVALPSTLTSVGDSTFNGCTSLATVYIRNNVTKIGSYAFQNCSALTSVSLPDSLTEIKNDAFKGCSQLASVTIPENVSFIGTTAFYLCSALKTVTFEGDKVTEILGGTFNSCTALTTVNLSKNVTKLDTNAFNNCTALTTVGSTDGLVTVGENAFNGCSSITSLTIPYGVTSLGTASLKSVPSVTFVGCESYWNTVSGFSTCGVGTKTFTGGCKIGDSAYIHLVDSENAVISGSGTVYSYDDYTGSPWYTYASTVKSVVFAENCPENIQSNMFKGYTALSSVTFSKGVKGIGSNAFDGCTALTSVTIGENVTTIGDYAFANCTALEKAEIPGNVTSLGDNIFASSGVKTCVIFNPDATVTANTFAGVEGITVYSPSGSAVNTALTDAGVSLPTGNGALTYTLNSDGKSYSVTGLTDKTCTFVVIPASYNGKPVNGIKDNAFKDAASLNNVYLQSGVIQSVGKNVMKNTGYVNSHANGDLTIGDICFGLKGSVSSVTIPDGVRLIADYAFAGKTCITSLTLPDSVETIGNYAFYGCSNMDLAGNTLYLKRFKESIDYMTDYCEHPGWAPEPNFDTGATRAYRESYNSIYRSTLGKGIKEIGEKAFYGCSALTALKLTVTDITIGSKAFEKCDKLYINVDYDNALVKTLFDNHIKALISDDSFEYIFKEDFSGLVLTYQREEVFDFVVPAYICEIPVKEVGYDISAANNANLYKRVDFGSNAYEKQESIKRVVIPDTVEIIRYAAIQSYDNCNSITLGNSLKIIEKENLLCPSITEITVPDSLEYAGWLCADSTTLKTINLPGKGNHLNMAEGFSLCSAVTEINNYEYIYCVQSDFCEGSPWMTNYLNNAANNSVLYIGTCAFATKGTVPQDVVIKEGTTSIGGFTFYQNTDIKTVDLPESLEVIGERAFQSAHSLVSVNLPDNLKYIGTLAFAYSEKLVFESFPSNLKDCYLGSYSFTNTTFKTCIIPDGVDVGKLYLSADTIVLPSSLKTIEGDTAGKTKTIYISEGTENICYDAFSNCSNLKTVYIPNSVTFIDDGAFNDMSSTATIICHKGSCAETFAKKKGYKYVSITAPDVKEGISLDFMKFYIITEKTGITDIADLFTSGTENILTNPSYEEDSVPIYGTGSFVDISNSPFTLIVKWDANGDGVCDEYDAYFIEAVLNGFDTALDYQIRAVTDNDTVSLEDYQALVNKVSA